MAPSKVSIHRMTHDVKALLESPVPGVSVWLPDENVYAVVEAQVMGPEDTPYAGGLFNLRIAFPDRYPLEPPNVKFKTKVYHPNVSHDGNICLSVLNMPPKGDWTPAHSLRTVLLSIQSLLSAPNPDDPLDAEAAKELKMHPHLFRRRAVDWTLRFANPDGRMAAATAKEIVAEEPGCSTRQVLDKTSRGPSTEQKPEVGSSDNGQSAQAFAPTIQSGGEPRDASANGTVSDQRAEPSGNVTSGHEVLGATGAVDKPLQQDHSSGQDISRDIGHAKAAAAEGTDQVQAGTRASTTTIRPAGARTSRLALGKRARV